MNWRPRNKQATIRLGAYVFRKVGGTRIDFRDPYRLAVALAWPRFVVACFTLYLAVNLVFASLFWVAPGSVVNAQASPLFRAKATMNLLTGEAGPDGKQYRRVRELRLERSNLPFFQLAWTLKHVLDERSPLYGHDAERVAAAKAHLFITMEAYDPTLSATVQDFRGYGADDIRFGLRYVDAVMPAEDGTLVLDLTRIEDLEPEDGTDHLEPGWPERE